MPYYTKNLIFKCLILQKCSSPIQWSFFKNPLTYMKNMALPLGGKQKND